MLSPQLRAGSVADHVYDLLWITDTWMPSHAIVERLSYLNPETVRTDLHRLRRKGLLQRRLVEQAEGGPVAEWKIT